MFNYQAQWRELNERISHYEDVVESQRQKLAVLNRTLEIQAEAEPVETRASAVSIANQISELKDKIAMQRADLEAKESQLGR